jgi:hypothetical protein
MATYLRSFCICISKSGLRICAQILLRDGFLDFQLLEAVMSVAWFVDGGYAFKAWQEATNTERLDYTRLRAEIERDAGKRSGTPIFGSDNDPPSAAQDSFHRYLRSKPPRGPGCE